MDISNIRNNGQYFIDKYINNFYVIVTYEEYGFILVREKDNFPHLMWISKNYMFKWICSEIIKELRNNSTLYNKIS